MSTTETHPTLVESVDFAVPSDYSIGERFPTWQAAVDHARSTIKRFEHPGQTVNPDGLYYHPRRHVQEGDTLVHYSRAFVHLRVVEPAQARPDFDQGTVRSGSDHVAMRWEVFADGTVEAAP